MARRDHRRRGWREEQRRDDEARGPEPQRHPGQPHSGDPHGHHDESHGHHHEPHGHHHEPHGHEPYGYDHEPYGYDHEPYGYDGPYGYGRHRSWRRGQPGRRYRHRHHGERPRDEEPHYGRAYGRQRHPYGAEPHGPGFERYGYGYGPPDEESRYGAYGRYHDREERAGPVRFGAGHYGDEPYLEHPPGEGGWGGEGRRGDERRGEGGRVPHHAEPGPHVGRGPRGWTRFDELLVDEVSYRMSVNGRLDATGIEVTAADGEITLTGTVPDRLQKLLARDIAWSVGGVRDVHNRLTLRAGAPEPTQEREERGPTEV